MSDHAQANVLSTVHDEWPRLCSEPALVEALKDCPFVLTSDGSHCRPTELYDPSQPLLEMVFRGKPLFPAEQYSFPSWLRVLRECGLVHRVEPATFLAAAQQLEAQGREMQDMTPSGREALARSKFRIQVVVWNLMCAALVSFTHNPCPSR